MTGRLSDEAQAYLDQLDALTNQAAVERDARRKVEVLVREAVEREQQTDGPIAWPDDVAERQVAA
jgi:hypothetical protein